MARRIVVALAVPGILIFACVALALGWLSWFGSRPVGVGSSQPIEFVVEEGASMTRVAQVLADRGWIDSSVQFILLAKRKQVADQIKAGEYLLRPGVTHNELLEMFTRGLVRYYDITLVEGEVLKTALDKLNSHAKLSGSLQEDKLQLLYDRLGIDGNPEGWFFPDTYYFESGASVSSILERAHTRMKRVLDEEWQRRVGELPYKTPYQALIMASLIEKETGADFEREKIAGVFVRRLERGMRLQTDPAVIYGLGENYQGNLNRRMLKSYTPYNTYLIRGLPPTPISLVGREAIVAALHPQEGDDLYFVARGDGTHYFSTTLAEHNRAVRNYQIEQRRKDYRSTVEEP